MLAECAGLAAFAKRVQIRLMDGTQQAAIHQALVSVQHAVTSMTFPSCDQEDLIEAIDRVEEQLHINHPNLALMCWFLNSIARSLRAQPEARDACLAIEDAIGMAGMPSTWQSGI
jgi:pyruvate/2-oxoglutarate dehydrogenase complex dihydrolipoamide acyltransferase (E2) component